MGNITIILIVLAAIVISSAITSLMTSRKMRAKVAYMLDALEDKELNFRFDESRLMGRRFNKTLNRLRGIFDKERHEIIEQEKYFGLMLDHVRTGVVVVDQLLQQYGSRTTWNSDIRSYTSAQTSKRISL